MPRWDSKRDGEPLKLLSEPPHKEGDQPGKAASARQPVGHTRKLKPQESIQEHMAEMRGKTAK